jgi:hypothetical protein
MVENQTVDRELYFPLGYVAALVAATNLPTHMKLVLKKHFKSSFRQIS